MSKRIKRGRRAAISAARSSAFYAHRVGAAIFKGSRLIAKGHNKKKTHPQMGESYSQHAEFSALIKFCQKHDCRDAVLFVARLTRTDKVSLAKPCSECRKKILSFGVQKVFYTNYKGEMEELKLAA